MVSSALALIPKQHVGMMSVPPDGYDYTFAPRLMFVILMVCSSIIGTCSWLFKYCFTPVYAIKQDVY